MFGALPQQWTGLHAGPLQGGCNLGLLAKEGPGCQPLPDNHSSLSAGGVLVPKNKFKREISLPEQYPAGMGNPLPIPSRDIWLLSSWVLT